LTGPWRSSTLRAVFLVLRLALGAMFVYAAWTKLREPWQIFAMSVDAYGVLPQWAVVWVARTLPWGELAIGLLLMAGRFLRVAAAAGSLLLLSLFSIMLRAHLSGLQIDCGCFGPGDPISVHTLLRDGTLLAATAALTAMAVWRARAARHA
jgi:uncharacterized membrane protein YphA (DoxX/SURF4 family)